MVRLTDNVYRMDHAVTKTQKTILKAFGIDAAQVKYQAAKISEKLAKQQKRAGGMKEWQGQLGWKHWNRR